MPVPAFTPAASTITVGLLLDRWLDEQLLGEDSGFSHLREGDGGEPGA